MRNHIVKPLRKKIISIWTLSKCADLHDQHAQRIAQTFTEHVVLCIGLPAEGQDPKSVCTGVSGEINRNTLTHEKKHCQAALKASRPHSKDTNNIPATTLLSRADGCERKSTQHCKVFLYYYVLYN